ncbi:MAG: NAD-dependent epimerase/dehydratase family protein [Angustibacter sp.]
MRGGAAMGHVVLVTGVSRPLGGRFIRLLVERPDVDRVIGVDINPPAHSIAGAEFVRADIRNPLIAKILDRSRVDTVVHLNVLATPRAVGSRVTMKEINVIGTMQLLAACQRAESLQRLIVKSSAAVYGSGPNDPALFTEDMEPKVPPGSGFGKDAIEVEGYVRGFARRRADVAVSVLRLANILGPTMDSTMVDYFSLPVLPRAIGHDPRLQFLHEEDALAALLTAALHPRAVGVVNVAGAGILLLSQAARLLGRPQLTVPLPCASWIGQVVQRAGLVDFSADQLEYLAHGRVLDTRRMTETLGFTPRWSTRRAFQDFAESARGPRPLLIPRFVKVVSALEQQVAARRRDGA